MKQLSIIKENKHYSPDELMAIFELDNTQELVEILLKFNQFGLLKIHSLDNVIYNNMGIESIFKSSSSGELSTQVEFSVKFVGIMELPLSRNVLAYPKYISDENIIQDTKENFIKFKKVLKVVRKYKNRISQNLAISDETISTLDSNLGLKLQILNQYYEKGLYNKEKEKIVNNGNGEILWDRTINENTSYIINDIPIYLDTVNREKVTDFMNTIREIHGVILSEISLRLKELLEVIDFVPVILTNKSLNDLGNLDYLCYLLELELGQQFQTEERELLNELILYIKNASSDSHGKFELFGTSSFNLVWEDICSVVYQNHLDYTFNQLEIINPQSSFSDYTTIKEYIEKPKWLNFDDQFISSKSTLELDVLNIDAGEFNIYDAKYYNIEFKNGKVYGQPGVSDITKQYLYQLVFNDVIKINNLKANNNFIIPKDNPIKDGEIYTETKMDMFHNVDKGLKPIKVIARDCDKIFDEYLLAI